MLVGRYAFKDSHKLEDKWGSERYMVLAQPNPEIPVFEVPRKNKKGPNLLLPFLSANCENEF